MQISVVALRTTVSICRLMVPGLSVVTYVWPARSETIDVNCGVMLMMYHVLMTTMMLPVPPSTLSLMVIVRCIGVFRNALIQQQKNIYVFNVQL